MGFYISRIDTLNYSKLFTYVYVCDHFGCGGSSTCYKGRGVSKRSRREGQLRGLGIIGEMIKQRVIQLQKTRS